MDDDRRARAGFYLGALEGLVRAGEDLLGEASRRAPIEEGTLRGSGALVIVVNRQRFEGSGAYALARRSVVTAAAQGLPVTLDVEVSFNTVYAARQHEEVTWAHPKAGEAKYLERPLVERAARYERIIGLAAARGAERGGRANA